MKERVCAESMASLPRAGVRSHGFQPFVVEGVGHVDKPGLERLRKCFSEHPVEYLELGSRFIVALCGDVLAARLWRRGAALGAWVCTLVYLAHRYISRRAWRFLPCYLNQERPRRLGLPLLGFCLNPEPVKPTANPPFEGVGFNHFSRSIM